MTLKNNKAPNDTGSTDNGLLHFVLDNNYTDQCNWKLVYLIKIIKKARQSKNFRMENSRLFELQPLYSVYCCPYSTLRGTAW